MTWVQIISPTCFSHAVEFEVLVRIIVNFLDISSMVRMKHPYPGTQIPLLTSMTCMMSHQMTLSMRCSLSRSKGAQSIGVTHFPQTSIHSFSHMFRELCHALILYGHKTRNKKKLKL